MMGKEGGKRIPRAPAPVISPSEGLSPYFAEVSTGINSGPKARMVTPEPPVKAVKNAQTKMVTMAGPALNCPTKD